MRSKVAAALYGMSAVTSISAEIPAVIASDPPAHHRGISMSAIITTLQLIVLVLCLYGELTRKIKSTPLVTVALGAIFVGTLISMSRTDAGSPSSP